MESKFTNLQSHRTEKQQKINSTTHTVFPRNRGCDDHAGALIDFLLSGRFLSLSRSKKVNEFLRVANIWNSGYSMGESIVISIQMHGNDDLISYLVKDTRRIYSKSKFNDNIKYGNLTLKIEIRDDGRGRYSISETRKKGALSYQEVLEAARESRKQLLKSKELRRQFEIHRIVTEDAVSYVIARLGISVDYKNIFERKPVYEEVTFDNYYVSTDVDFQSITTNDIDIKISELWARMKDSEKYRYHHSPLSCSQYLENRENGVIYRFSDHWGSCASCFWTLDGRDDKIVAIGQAKLGDFHKRTPKEWVRMISNEGFQTALDVSVKDMQIIENLLSNYQFQGKARQCFEKLQQLCSKVNDAMNIRDISMITVAIDAVNDYIRSL